MRAEDHKPADAAGRRKRDVAASFSIALVGLLAVWATDTASQSPATDRPDIVVIMADDLDTGSLNAAVEGGFMPNLVRYILDAGTQFTESFVTLSLCCPSRSTFLTGLYPHNHGVVRNNGPSGGFQTFHDMFEQSAPLAGWLQATGYRTAHVGKYLNGYSNYRIVPRGWSEWRALVDSTTYCMYNYRVSKNGAELLDFGIDPGEPADEYQTDVLARMAEEIISTSGMEPLFLSLAPLAPHRESSCLPADVRPAPRHAGTVNLALPMPPSFNEADMSDKPRWMRRLRTRNETALRALYNHRIEALRSVDDLIGTVAVALRSAGRLERTAFIFTSDNGFSLGQHRWESKIVVYEESIRVPLAIRIPGVTAARRVGQLALNNDLAPTIAALAGATPTFPVDGRSLVPLLRGGRPTWRTRFLVEYPPVAPSDVDPLGLDGDVDVQQPVTQALPPFRAIRTGDTRFTPGLVYAESLDTTGAPITDRELYDLDLDPYQLQSLHNDPSPLRAQQRRTLKRQLDALTSCGGGTCQALEEQ